MSSGSSVNDALTGYAAGRLTAQQLVGVVTAEYWIQEPGSRSRELLRPIMEVIEKAHPGIVALSGSSERPGFAVQLAERPFPKRYDADLRTAVQAVVLQPIDSPAPSSRLQAPGLFSRIVRAIRKIFNA
jgi:hypothetical protein